MLAVLLLNGLSFFLSFQIVLVCVSASFFSRWLQQYFHCNSSYVRNVLFTHDQRDHTETEREEKNETEERGGKGQSRKRRKKGANKQRVHCIKIVDSIRIVYVRCTETYKTQHTISTSFLSLSLSFFSYSFHLLLCTAYVKLRLARSAQSKIKRLTK